MADRQTWELWRTAHESIYLPAEHPQKDFLTAGMRKVWTTEASDYNDAMTQYYEHMGWDATKPYQPIE